MDYQNILMIYTCTVSLQKKRKRVVCERRTGGRMKVKLSYINSMIESLGMKFFVSKGASKFAVCLLAVKATSLSLSLFR